MTPSRPTVWAAAFGILVGAAGCGGGAPPTGARAVVPANYQEKQDAIAAGFRGAMQEQKARGKRPRAARTGAAPGAR